MLRTFLVAFALVGLAASPSVVLAEPHGGGHAPPQAGPVGGRPDGVDYSGDTRHQQANQGRGGGCAGCSVQDRDASWPAGVLALGVLALWARRRNR